MNSLHEYRRDEYLSWFEMNNWLVLGLKFFMSGAEYFTWFGLNPLLGMGWILDLTWTESLTWQGLNTMYTWFGLNTCLVMGWILYLIWAKYCTLPTWLLHLPEFPGDWEVQISVGIRHFRYKKKLRAVMFRNTFFFLRELNLTLTLCKIKLWRNC